MGINVVYDVEINASEKMGMLEGLADALGTKLTNGRIQIPERFGRGFLHGFTFNPFLRMMVSNYELKHDLIVTRIVGERPGDRIILSFRNIFDGKHSGAKLTVSEMPSVSIATQGLTMGIEVPRNTAVRSILVAVDANYLKEVITSKAGNPLLDTIFENKQPLIFEQLVYASLQKTADEIASARIPDDFAQFFYRIKAEELICNLFIELSKRGNTSVQPLNIADVRSLYAIREKLTLQLEACPSITAMAKEANMSESKLQRLFKQVFGATVYNYYQSFRMQEASRLLREEGLSVSETGYRLGFTNLSHFARVFEDFHGLKPKRYAISHIHPNITS